MTSSDSPAEHQEAKYDLPYHWFPEDRLPRFCRAEKKRIVCDLIRDHSEGTVESYLDVGCGDGRWTSDIFDILGSQARAFGIDISERAVAFARLISPQVDFRVFDGRTIPFSDHSFDLVTSIEVIEHIDDDTEALHLEEIRRVLRPHGLLVLTTPSVRLPLPAHHLRHYTTERLEALVRNSGLELVDLRGQTHPIFSRFSKLRKIMNRFPFLWKSWCWAARERAPGRSLQLLLAARER